MNREKYILELQKYLPIDSITINNHGIWLLYKPDIIPNKYYYNKNKIIELYNFRIKIEEIILEKKLGYTKFNGLRIHFIVPSSIHLIPIYRTELKVGFDLNTIVNDILKTILIEYNPAKAIIEEMNE